MDSCKTCKNPSPFRKKYRYDEKEKITRESCDHCGSSSFVFPDVYFDKAGQEEHIVFEDVPSSWLKGTYVSSRAQKAALYKQMGVREAGDRVHGARNFEKRRTYFL